MACFFKHPHYFTLYIKKAVGQINPLLSKIVNKNIKPMSFETIEISLVTHMVNTKTKAWIYMDCKLKLVR